MYTPEPLTHCVSCGEKLNCWRQGEFCLDCHFMIEDEFMSEDRLERKAGVPAIA